MSHVAEGPIANYNSLQDRNLSNYFNNQRIKKHLVKAGLITRQGALVSEETYRLKHARREHRRMVKELLSEEVVKRTMELERYRQAIIRRKLEEISKVETVRRLRGQKGRKGDEEILPLLLPRPKKREEANELGSLIKPATNVSTKTSVRNPYCYDDDEEELEAAPTDETADNLYPKDRCFRPPIFHRSKSESAYPIEKIQSFNLINLDPTAIAEYTERCEDVDTDIARPPYTECYPRSRRARKADLQTSASTNEVKQRAFQHTLKLAGKETAKFHQARLQSMCEVTMRFLGLNIPGKPANDQYDVVIEQQHCGGNTILVFKHCLAPGDKFAFVSRRHRNYPFSVTIYVDGKVDCRVSACCEYKHRQGCRLGGKNGHFKFLDVTGAAPCYKCQIEKALNLTSRPSRNETCLKRRCFKTGNAGKIGKGASAKCPDKNDNNNQSPRNGENNIGGHNSSGKPGKSGSNSSSKNDDNTLPNGTTESTHPTTILKKDYDVRPDSADSESFDGALIMLRDTSASETEPDDEQPTKRASSAQPAVAKPKKSTPPSSPPRQTSPHQRNPEPSTQAETAEQRPVVSVIRKTPPQSPQSTQNNAETAEQRSVVSVIRKTPPQSPQSTQNKAETAEQRPVVSVIRKTPPQSPQSTQNNAPTKPNSNGKTESETTKPPVKKVSLESPTQPLKVKPPVAPPPPKNDKPVVAKTVPQRNGTPLNRASSASNAEQVEVVKSEKEEKSEAKPPATPALKVLRASSASSVVSGSVPPPATKKVSFSNVNDVREYHPSEPGNLHTTPTQQNGEEKIAVNSSAAQPSDEKTSVSTVGRVLPDDKKADAASSTEESGSDESESSSSSSSGKSDSDKTKNGNDEGVTASDRELIKKISSDSKEVSIMKRPISIEAMRLLAEHVEKRSDIEKVIIRQCSLVDSSWQILADALRRSNNPLKMVCLNMNRLTVSAMPSLVSLMLAKKSTLRQLLLFGNSIEDRGVGILLAGIQGRMLDVESNGSEASEPPDAGKTIAVPLTHLDLGEVGLTSVGMIRLSATLENMTQLKVLNLGGNPQIQLEGWQRFAEALKGKSFPVRLALNYNRLGNKIASILALSLASNRGIEMLDLEHCAIADQGGDSLVQMCRASKSLKDIFLEGNRLSSDLIKDIEESLRY